MPPGPEDVALEGEGIARLIARNEECSCAGMATVHQLTAPLSVKSLFFSC